MRDKKTAVGFQVAIAIVVSVVVGALLWQCTSKKNEIVVAIVSSLTGDLAENGKDMKNGAQMAFEEANEAGGVHGRSIRFEIFDDQGDPKVAVSIASRVCQDPRVVAVVGHLTSGCMSAAAPIYARAEMPVVMPVPTNPEITRKGYTNLFRVPPTDDDQAPFLAEYLLSRDPKAPVAVISDLTAYGLGFATAFRETFRAGGGKILAFEGAQREARDFRSLITKLKALKPKYVLLGATYDMGAPFVRQMKELGLDATVLSGDGCYGSAFLDQAGNAAEGTIVSFIAPDRGFSPATERFFRKYESKYGKVVSFAPLGYDAAQVVVEALRQSGKLAREEIIATIRTTTFILEGITGEIQFEENGDNRNKNLVLYVVQQGKFVLLK